MRIVYMGTPDFAVEPLRKLVEAGKDVVAVVTMPDKPAGRGHHVQMSPVKQYAASRNLPVLQPANLKDAAFVDELRSYRADLQIVVAFRMLPEVVWGMPRLGTFNLHASLLPQYRGAAPINWAIINGDTESGVTTFFLKHEIDTGDIIMQERVAILPEDNAGDLHDKLMAAGSDIVVRTVEQIESGAVCERPQEEVEMRAAPKIFKETCRLRFDRTAREVHNMVRGLAPYPAAWIEIERGGDVKSMKVYASRFEEVAHDTPAGTLVTDGRRELKVAVADGYVHLTEVQLAGKKRMPAADLLRGADLRGYVVRN